LAVTVRRVDEVFSDEVTEWASVMSEQAGPNIRVLKRVVIVLGILIVISFAVVIWGVTRESETMMSGGATATMAGTAPRGGFGEVPVAVPSGSRLVGVTADGERGLLRMRLRDGSDKVIIVDLGTGKVLGALVVDPGPLVQD
jgi:hypothetical protein